MKFEFDYANMTTEQLNKQYFHCNNRIKELEHNLKIQKFVNKFFFIYFFVVWIMTYIGIFNIIDNYTIATILGLVFTLVHFYYSGCCLAQLETQSTDIKNTINEINIEIEKINTYKKI